MSFISSQINLIQIELIMTQLFWMLINIYIYTKILVNINDPRSTTILPCVVKSNLYIADDIIGVMVNSQVAVNDKRMQSMHELSGVLTFALILSSPSSSDT